MSFGGGLELYDSEGLPYGNEGFNSKGRLMLAENASLSESIWACNSGSTQSEEQRSRIRMCRVK